MTKINKNNQKLKKQISASRAVAMLIPAYQNLLAKLASGGDLTLQKAVSLILEQEKGDDLQSVYFTEKTLRDFIGINWQAPAQGILLKQYRELATHLIRTFLFFNSEEKAQILPKIAKLQLPALYALIDLYRQGHRKQLGYLQAFAEKDPGLAAKFTVLASQARATTK